MEIMTSGLCIAIAVGYLVVAAVAGVAATAAGLASVFSRRPRASGPRWA
jgi:hypothetical protein